MSGQLKSHPLADLFPMMSAIEIEQLASDIAENGLRECGLLHEGKILDGRNRSKACQLAGVEMDWQDTSLDDSAEAFDAVGYVISKNLHRRQLTNGQRSFVAARLATMKRGNPSNSSYEEFENSRDDAAKLLQVSKASIDRAKVVLKHGAASVVSMAEANELPVGTAERLVKSVPDKKEQDRLAKAGKKAINEHLKQLSAASPPAPEKPSRARKVLPEIVKSFRRSENKANDLRVFIEDLDPSFRQLLRDWLTEAPQ